MPNTLELVEKHHGTFLPINQNAIKEHFETTHRKPFDGACVGVVAGFLEVLFIHSRFYPQFFSNPLNNKWLLPSPAKCVSWQNHYERSSKNFFLIFIRDVLRFPKGDAKEDGFKNNIHDVLSIMNPEDQTTDIIVINIIFKLNVDNETYYQDHKMCISKVNDQYIFCEPNYGLVLFKSLEHLKNWLADEVSNGSLQHFSKPVPKNFILVDSKTKGLQHGLLSVNSIYYECFSKPAPKAMLANEHWHKARL